MPDSGTAATRPTAARLACPAIEGLEPLLQPGAGVLFGELHGTVESPAVVAAAACLAVRAGRAVTVALEVPREEQARVDAFLASTGSATDRDALLAGSFWTDVYQDGRRSEAMVALLDAVRRLRADGSLRVVLFDRRQPPERSQDRDRWMAEALAQAFAETPQAVLLALTGNVHSRVGRGTPWDADYEAAGFVLVGLRPELRITALDVAYPDGTAWTCTSGDPASCQARPLRGRGEARDGGRVTLHPELTAGHHGVYAVSSLTASPPAAR